jgi:transposase-like protein
MTSKTTNRFSPEVRARAVRTVLDHASEYPLALGGSDVDCGQEQTQHDWVKKAEVDSGHEEVKERPPACVRGFFLRTFETVTTWEVAGEPLRRKLHLPSA